MRIFLICPVRISTPEIRAELDAYVAKLEAAGHTVHYPPRDTDQNDPCGIHILETNRQAIELADEVHVYWSPTSLGSHFDFGTAFALRKPLRLANHLESKPFKAFENVLLLLDAETARARV